MKKIEYRFKTEKEFREENRWSESNGCPDEWDVEMNEYLGQQVPIKFNSDCDLGNKLHISGWSFEKEDYVLIDESKYFNDLSQHIGRKIIALKNAPYSGSVKKGDVLTIVDYSKAIIETGSYRGLSYACTGALNLGHLGVLFDLIEEERESNDICNDVLGIINIINNN